MTIHRSVEFEQPDFMWQYMLRYERCVVAQYEVQVWISLMMDVCSQQLLLLLLFPADILWALVDIIY